MEKETKKTPLHEWHTAHGANMGDFGGYHMPLWYSGSLQEHLAVITKSGIFDTSHMAVVMVTGPDSFDLLQLCFTRDLNACGGKGKTPIEQGRCVYGVFLNEKGESIDDAIVYKIADSDYMVVVNAGMGGAIAQHLEVNRSGRTAAIADLTDKLGKLDIQGPTAAKILKKVIKNPQSVLEDMIYFSFKGHFDKGYPGARQVELIDGNSILLSRSGYTGEFGFELFIASDQLVEVWGMLIEAGKDLGLIPSGLAARDSLRTGAMLPLSHQDIGPWPFINNPWSFALPFSADRSSFTKRFNGDEALTTREKPEYTYAFAGFDPRKVALCSQPQVLNSIGEPIGVVLTCVTDMAIGRHNGKIYSIASPNKPENFKPRGLSCGFLKVRSKLNVGDMVELKDSRRSMKVMIVADIRPDRTARRPMREFM